MKFIVSALLILLIQPVGLGAEKDRKLFPFEYQKLQLENGFTAYLIKAGPPAYPCRQNSRLSAIVSLSE